jgi:hypothetical protein
MRILTLLCLAQVLSAQAGGEGGDFWSALRSNNPPGLPIELRLIDPHAFHQGELIRAELKLPPAEQWQFGGILLDPASSCGTVAKPCFVNEGGIVAGPVSRPDLPSLALNAYLPALPPGDYRMAALARKLVRRSYRPGSAIYNYSDPLQYAVSVTVEIDIIAASAAWVQDTIARSVAILPGPPPRDPAGYQAQRDAAQQLAFLNLPAAWTASLDLLPKEEAVLLAGLERGRPPARVCDLMQARVAAPAQSAKSAGSRRGRASWSRCRMCANRMCRTGSYRRAEATSAIPLALRRRELWRRARQI